MKQNLLALAGVLTLVLACGKGRTEGQTAGAAVEDTTAAPSSDVGTPTRDTAADTGGSEVRMRPHEGPLVNNQGDTVGRTGGRPE